MLYCFLDTTFCIQAFIFVLHFLMSSVAHRFGHVEFWISKIYFDFFKCICLQGNSIKYSKFDTFKSMSYQGLSFLNQIGSVKVCHLTNQTLIYPLQLNEYDTDLYYCKLSQHVTNDCLLIYHKIILWSCAANHHKSWWIVNCKYSTISCHIMAYISRLYFCLMDIKLYMRWKVAKNKCLFAWSSMVISAIENTKDWAVAVINLYFSSVAMLWFHWSQSLW